MTSLSRFTCVSRTLSFCLVLVPAVVGCSSASNEYDPPPPPEVTYANPIEAPITPFIDENGITEATNESEVRSRVRGFLKTIDFQPGQFVKKNDVLYTIETDQYEASVESATAAVETAAAAIGVAEAEVKIAEAAVLKASQDLDREERLKEQNASSQAQYDAAVAETAAAKASLESAKANVKSAQSQKLQAQAALRQAELDLNYTVVRAEIDGNITKSNLKVGNLVENGSQLATIVDDRNVFANFSVSDRAVLRIMEAKRLARSKSASSGDSVVNRDAWRGTPVYLAREGDRGYPFEGKLDDVDQAGVEVNTGTLGLRGIFENPDEELMPGLFVSLRVPAADAVNSLLIPERAVLRDQEGTFVLTIGSDNKVGVARINLGQAVSGWAIVLEGLEPSTRVMVDGLQFARPGAMVLPIEARYEVDANLLLRGLSDPSQSVKASPPVDTGHSSEDAVSTPNQPTEK